jgi:hypothetical protein
MATIKSYSDLEQSRKLAEILPLESADMYYYNRHIDLTETKYEVFVVDKSNKYVDFFKSYAVAINNNEIIPCWGLASLLGVLDYPQLSKDKLGSGKVGWMVSVYPNDCRYDSCWHDNPVDACVAMIEKLHELNLL